MLLTSWLFGNDNAIIIVTGCNLLRQIFIKYPEAVVFRSYQHPLHIIKVAQKRGDEIFMKLSSRVSKKRHKTFHSANCCFIIISPHINLDNYFVAVRWETTNLKLKIMRQKIQIARNQVTGAPGLGWSLLDDYNSGYCLCQG